MQLNKVFDYVLVFVLHLYYQNMFEGPNQIICGHFYPYEAIFTKNSKLQMS